MKEIIKNYWPYALIIGVVGFYTYNRIRIGKIRKALKAELYKPTEKYGTIQDFAASAFNRTYYKTAQPQTGLILQFYANLNKWAERLYKAMYGIGTNEDEIYSVFNEARNKAQLSQLSEFYYNKYKKDLKSEIDSELDDDEMIKLTDIIRSIPDKTYKK